MLLNLLKLVFYSSFDNVYKDDELVKGLGSSMLHRQKLGHGSGSKNGPTSKIANAVLAVFIGNSIKVLKIFE